MTREQLLEQFKEPIKVGHDSFVRLVDVMGDDSSIVQAARVSYGAGTKSVSGDRGLIRYLMRHKHCYTSDMEVLTQKGWLRWDECRSYEYFAVPDPQTKRITFEYLSLEMFDYNDNVYAFQNNRMSYRVTHNHRMWFKPKYQDTYSIFKVEEMNKWGHFESVNSYKWYESHSSPDFVANRSDFWNRDLDARFQFLGFYLGDGSFASTNRITFHLRKSRKKEYLRNLLNKLKLSFEEKQSSTYEDAIVFWIDLKSNTNFFKFIHSWLGSQHATTAKTKALAQGMIECLDADCSAALLDGLINSDGSLKTDRDQIEFSSASIDLITLFERCATLVLGDTHRVGAATNGVYNTVCYLGSSTTLEARKQYFYQEHYLGSIYCTTTSTGLLIVRGGPDKFAFVCGNSTPMEMCEIKLHLRMPVHVCRQWIRHRTASVNERSTRYSVIDDGFEVTSPGEWRKQSSNNKQGSSGLITDWPLGYNTETITIPERRNYVFECGGAIDPVLTHIVPAYQLTRFSSPYGNKEYSFDYTPQQYLSDRERELQTLAQEVYDEALLFGVAREQARDVLPLATYTELYWKIDLHNLFHFLKLRLDSHAQLEIRELAQAIAKIVEQWVPIAYEAFVDYSLDACYLSKQERSLLGDLLESQAWDLPTLKTKLTEYGILNREQQEFIDKFNLQE